MGISYTWQKLGQAVGAICLTDGRPQERLQAAMVAMAGFVSTPGEFPTPAMKHRYDELRAKIVAKASDGKLTMSELEAKEAIEEIVSLFDQIAQTYGVEVAISDGEVKKAR